MRRRRNIVLPDGVIIVGAAAGVKANRAYCLTSMSRVMKSGDSSADEK